MKKFSLIKQLDAGEQPIDEASKIDYQQYELIVEGKTQRVNIPRRESKPFETEVAKLTEKIDSNILRKLLRTFRGTRS
ncbi:MAG: hypothetical protein KAS32_25505 [Candidatus Peribacteraceae bacterium]|nr:hypothetical protein [Candidatus Peribacteraceae bacterium]